MAACAPLQLVMLMHAVALLVTRLRTNIHQIQRGL